MKATCAKCRCAFEREAGETWKRLCIDCWKSGKAKEASNESLLRDQVSALQERLWRAESRARLLELRGGQFDMEELKTLRRLCHPDRHGGSEASTRISQRINQMLNGER